MLYSRGYSDLYAAIAGCVVRACLGTTKYCNSFLKGLACNSKDCLYLHSFGDLPILCFITSFVLLADSICFLEFCR